MGKSRIAIGSIVAIAGMFAAFLVVMAALLVVAVPMFVRGRVVGLVEAELDRQLGATVRFDEVSLSLLTHFPDVTVGVRGLKVVGEAPFEGVELASVDELSLTLDLMSVVAGSRVELERLAVVRPRLNVIVDAEGRSNTDILPASGGAGSGEGSSYDLALKDYAIEDLELVYDDRAAGRRLRLTDLDHRGQAAITSERTAVETRTDIADIALVDGGVDLLRNVRLGWDLNADIEQPSGKITLRDNRLALNDLVVSATGTVAPAGDDLQLDLTFEALETSFKSLLSLVPAVYSDGFESMVSEGTLALNGHVRGTLASSGERLPGFGVDLKVADGAFRYPELPGVEGVHVDARVEHPGGDPDAIVVDVAQFRMALDGQPIEGTLKLRNPQTDPDVEAKLKGRIDLAQLRQALPSAEVNATGKIDVDVDVAGRLSAFEAQDVDAVRALGTIRMVDVLYEDPEQAVPMHVDRLTVTLDPRRVDVADLKMRLGASDLAGTMQVDNLLSYLLADAVLVGRAELQSRSLDLDALAGADEEGEPTEEGSSSIYVIPKDLDVDVGLKLDQVRYGGRDYREVRGRIATKDGALRMNDLRMKLLDGSVTLNGLYQAEDEQAADVEVSVDVRELGLAGALDAFETLRRIAPVAEKSKGRFNSKIGATLRLGPDLSPDLASLFSDGNIQLLGLALQPEAMKKVASKVKNGRFDSIDLDDTALQFEIKNGKLRIDPTTVAIGGSKATLKGTTGTLDQSLDLRIDLEVPVKDIGAADLLGGLSVGTIPVVVKIGGTYTDPKVTVDVGKALENVAEDLKEQVVAEVGAKVDEAVDAALEVARKQGDALVAEAEKQAAALIAEAKSQADKLRKTAKKEGRKLVEQANNPVAKKLAEEGAAKLEQEADKAAKKVEREADKAAASLVDAANAERERLLTQAAAQAKARTP